MSGRTAESGRLWFLIVLFLIMTAVIGVSFARAVNDINAQTSYILEIDVSRK